MTAGRLKLGMVGGGDGAFIGGVHRMAARLDDRWTLVAGAFSSDAARSQAFGRSLGLDETRCYGDWRTMAKAESARPDPIDAVAIVTPNHMHHAPAKAFLDAGVAVICDKPLTTTLADALDLAETVKRTGLPFVLTHNYSGYAMVRQMRAMVAAGTLGAIRVVQAEVPGAGARRGPALAGFQLQPLQPGAVDVVVEDREIDAVRIGQPAEEFGKCLHSPASFGRV